ncbi:MAG: hypothetical protein KF760_17885 [Candidatus Eremiobacteraeota bacterium]|nr:hypothetical protein [Candidatus Eremiobacteraeota bacterium]MCW5869252.1 hypothetical protein [Candidatus Eremiobacteraeota bacterium]
MSQLNQIRTHVINRLVGAGTPPTLMQVQLLLAHIQAYHISQFSRPAFEERIERTETGIRIREAGGDADGTHLKAVDLVAQSNYNVDPYNQRQAELTPSAEKAAEYILFTLGGKTGWDLQQRIVATEAWRNTPAGPRGTPNHLDWSALAASLYPAEATSTMAGW